MGYIDPAYNQAGTEIFINVRGRNIEAIITDMPFVAPKTKTAKKQEVKHECA